MKIVLSLIFIVFLMSSCASSKLGWKNESGEKEKKYNEDFDPSSLKDDDLKFPVNKVFENNTETDKNESEIIPENTPEEVYETEIVTMNGYRVQLLATPYQKQAREAKQKAIFKIEEKVYLEFESPLWKLRVGNCRTKKEAEQLRNKMRSIGRRAGEEEWTNAWIVYTKIKVEKKVKKIY